MDEIDMSESFLQEEEKNQFLDGEFKYQNCPHCQRNFFIGKLKYHLKLCKPTNPMKKSPLKKTKRSYVSTALQKSEPEIQNSELQSPTSFRSPQKYKKCQYCRATFPLSMLQRHSQKCNLRPSTQVNPEDFNKLKSKTKIDFGIKKDLKEPSSALPRIRNSAKQHKNIDRKFVSQEVKDLKTDYTVRIRQDLSCFKKALEVQQIQCQYCHRKFSKEASLRHIPICEKIKLQEMHQVTLKKHSRSEVYKLSVPIKKSTLFRSKFLGNLSQKNDELEIKSARVHELEKVQREKINNSSLMMKREEQKERRLSDLKPLMVESNHIEVQMGQKSNTNKVKDTSSLEMNMTFSKNMNVLKGKVAATLDISAKKQNSQRLPTFEKDEESIENQTKPYFVNSKKLPQVKNEETEEVENQFLDVTVSKKKFFAEIVFDGSQSIFEKKIQSPKKQQQNFAEKIKLKIDLKDVSNKNEQKPLQEAKEYQLDFED